VFLGQLKDGGGDIVNISSVAGRKARAVATELPTHITHGATRQGTEEVYSRVEVTAEDVAEVIAFVVSRPKRLAIHEVLLRPAGQEL
jgi:NADP-dependent 3-hydroxy acid dehydrogenase YdfG